MQNRVSQDLDCQNIHDNFEGKPLQNPYSSNITVPNFYHCGIQYAKKGLAASG